MITLPPSSLRSTAFNGVTDTNAALTRQNADPAGFASLLRQSQAVPPPPPPMPVREAAPPSPSPAPAPTPPTHDASTSSSQDPERASANQASEAPPPPQTALKPHTAAKAATHPADDPTPDDTAAAKRADATPDATDATTTTAATAKPGDTPATGTAMDPSLMQWLAGLQRNPQAPASKADAATGDAAPMPLPGTDARGAAEARALAADLKAKDALQQTSPVDLPAATGSTEFGALLASQQDTDTPAAGTHGAPVEGVKDAAAALGGVFSPTPTGAAAAPAAVTVATPVNAPDFAHELGLHLSVLAKDGVQTAELHLNPADMGPVSVQIVMDGTQAHVAFGADMAATRQAIEAGLPQLAGALADAGFTLAGGGVSQHAGGRGGSDSSGPSGGSQGGRGRAAGSAAVSQVAAAAQRVVTEGGVDLFA